MSARPLDPATAWSRVRDRLAAPSAEVPAPAPRHADVLGSLVLRHQPTGTAVPDAHLAPLAVEHGVAVCSADPDFAGVRWFNPLRG